MSIINKGGAEELQSEIAKENPMGFRYEKEILAQFNALHSQDIWPDVEIEEYLANDLFQNVRAMRQRPTYPMDLPRFSPSSASNEVMDMWLKAKGYKEHQERYPYHRRWTRNSTAVHEAVQHDLIYSEKYTEGFFEVEKLDNGMPAWEHNIKTWKEYTHNDQTFIVSGMMDGILRHKQTGERIGFEFKTKSNTEAQVGHYLMKEAYSYHVDQTVAYFLLTGIRDYLLVYEGIAKPRWNKMAEARNDMRAFHVYITDEMANELLDKWAYATKLINEGTPPEDQTLGFFSGYQHLFKDGKFIESSKPEKPKHYRNEVD